MSYERLPRVSAKYGNASKKFLLGIDNQFTRQYSHIYASRLWIMQQEIEILVRDKWGTDIPVRKLSELKHDELCIVIGTIFKNMALKPSVLKDLSEEFSIMPQPIRPKYVDIENDTVCLEDELQRILLVGVEAHKLVSGAVVAVCGLESSESIGKFKLDRPILHCPVTKQQTSAQIQDDKYIIFISGLELGSHDFEPLCVQLLIDVITGHLGQLNNHLIMSRILRVVIAGNSLSRETQDKDQANRARYLTKKSAILSKDAVGLLDDILTQLAATVNVDLMPGECDPATYALPQQPMHRCLYPNSSKHSTFQCVTNPYKFDIDEIEIIGSSGQPVEDLFKFTSMDDRLEILARTLEVGHLSPTSPDTVPCYPYADTDPFVMDTCPHILFSGNAPNFASKIITGPRGQRTLLVTIPKFSVTRSCVMVNLRNLESTSISVGLDDFYDEN